MVEVAENTIQRDDPRPPEERADSTALFSQLLRGSGWALAGRCGAVAGLMLMNALLTRILVPQEVGAFFLIFSVVVAAASLSQLGLPLAIVNLVGDAAAHRRWGRVRGAVRTTVWSAAGALGVASLLMLAFGPALTLHVFQSPIVSAAMKIGAAWLAVRGIQTLLAEIFRALKDLRSATIHSGFLSALISVLAFAAIWWTGGHASLAETLWVSIAAGTLDVIL